MLLPSCFSVGIVGSSTSFFFSIRCKNYYILGHRIVAHVSYNQLGYSEPAHNVLPYKLNDLFIFDGCEGFFPASLSFSVSWFVIMIVWVAAQILFSSVEYLFALLYNSSIVVGGPRDSEWKKGVDGPKLLLKF